MPSPGPNTPCDGNSSNSHRAPVIIPILQVRKLKFQEGKKLTLVAGVGTQTEWLLGLYSPCVLRSTLGARPREASEKQRCLQAGCPGQSLPVAVARGSKNTLFKEPRDVGAIPLAGPMPLGVTFPFRAASAYIK